MSKIKSILDLRGPALARATAELVELRAKGLACPRCPRLLAAGARCPTHGRQKAPKLREGFEAIDADADGQLSLLGGS